jgi:hypothetical protein
MNRDKKIFLCLSLPLLIFIGFIMATFYMILTVLAGMILGALIGGTMRRDRIWRRLNRLAVILFLVFFMLFPNVTRWPEQIGRRLPGGRQSLLEPAYSGFPALNASFHEYYLWKTAIPFESAPDLENETRSVDEYIRQNRTKYIFDYTNPAYLLNDHLPTVDEVFHSDFNGDGFWEDDCDGISLVTASFLIFLGYNAFISETYFHWQTIVFPAGADPRTESGYRSGIILYRINQDELNLSFYLFNQTELFIAPTLTVWDGIRDNIFDPWIVEGIFGDTGLEPWVFAIAIPLLAFMLCLLFATLLRIFNWKLRPNARVYKESAKGAIILASVLYVLLVLFLNDLSSLGNIILFGGVGATLAFLDPRLHTNEREKQSVKIVPSSTN